MGITVSKQVHPEISDPRFINGRKNKQYDEIDRYVSEVSTSVNSDTLVTELTRTTNEPIQKVRAFYKWITQNKSSRGPVFTNGTLQSKEENKKEVNAANGKESVELFCYFCRSVGIPAKVIPGFHRSTTVRSDDYSTYDMEPNHYWNAVQINGEWKIVDCLCGALQPSADDEKGNDAYFFARPEMFILTHFPLENKHREDNRSWQLLRTPITLDEFNKSLRISEKAILWELNITPREYVIEVTETTDLLIEDTNENLEEMMVEMYTSTGENIDRYTFGKRERQSLFRITIKPPTIGQFRLVLYGRDSIYSESILVAQYIVKCVKTLKGIHPYPFNKGLWGVQKRASQFGFLEIFEIQTNLVSTTGELDIKLQTNKSNDVFVRLIGTDKDHTIFDEFAQANASNNEVSIRARFPYKDMYKLELYCKEEQLFYRILVFLVQCTTAVFPCQPFQKKIDRVWV